MQVSRGLEEMQCSQKLHGFSPVVMPIDFPFPSVISQSLGILLVQEKYGGPRWAEVSHRPIMCPMCSDTYGLSGWEGRGGERREEMEMELFMCCGEKRI